MLIQILLVAAITVVVLFFLRNRNAMRFQAGKKMLFALFVLACLVAVVYPDGMTALAHLVGVGRGADLILYALVVAFVFVSLNTYLKFRDYEARLTRLARRVAIAEARAQHRDGQPWH